MPVNNGWWTNPLSRGIAPARAWFLRWVPFHKNRRQQSRDRVWSIALCAKQVCSHTFAKPWPTKWFANGHPVAIEGPRSLSMENRCAGRDFGRRGGCAGASMMRHHAPALRCLVIHIGGEYIGCLRAVSAQHFDTFDQVVHGAGQ